MRTVLFPVLAALIIGAAWYGEVIIRPAPHEGRIVIAYWEKWTGQEGEAMRAVVNAFNESQDKIWVNYLPISGVDQKSLLSIAGGMPPDVMGLWDNNVCQFADDEAVMPLDDYCKEFGIKGEDYIPAYWNICEFKGHVYALPTTPASTALHYNTRLFKEAGLDPTKPPKTIEELDAYAEKLTKRDESGKLEVAGFMPNEPGWWNWAWMYMFGGKLWNGKDKFTATDPGNIRAFEWVRSYSKKYGPGELHSFRAGFGNFDSPQNGFMAEKLAMVIQGVWMANFIHNQAPKVEWAAAPFPYPADRPDLANSTIIGLDVLAIPRGCKHPDEAFEFIRFVQSKEGMELLCLGQKKHTPFMKVSPEFVRKHSNPYIVLFSDLAKTKNAFAAPEVGLWPEYNQEIGAAFESVLLLEKTPKEALEAVQARMQPKLDEYLKVERLREATR